MTNMGQLSLAAVAILSACSFSRGAPPAASAPDAESPDGHTPVAADAAATASWHVIETMTIDTTTTVPASSQTTLASGMTYHLRASGTFGCTYANTPADAEYWDVSPPNDLASPVDFGLGIDDVTIDGTKTPHWGPYTSTHVYEVPYTGRGMPLRAVLYDSQYDNNTGTLTLEILAP